ncbi:MAG: hypothetical protein AB7V25_17260 [Mangrovibacterium sp.]
MRKIVLIILLFGAGLFGSRAQTIFIEAESFSNKGAWVIDQQSMDQMGSPYLLAHGLGIPVEDAVTTIPITK